MPISARPPDVEKKKRKKKRLTARHILRLKSRRASPSPYLDAESVIISVLSLSLSFCSFRMKKEKDTSLPPHSCLAHDPLSRAAIAPYDSSRCSDPFGGE